ncbi:MAG: DUF1570 domain-containing protein [Gemmataceae bacterium]
MRQSVSAVVLLLCAALARADNPAPTQAQAWKFDVVTLKTNPPRVLVGLLGDETPRGVRFRVVQRNPGRPTLIFPTLLKRDEIAQIVRLGEEDRKLLQERIQEIEQNAPEAEKERLGALELQPIVWAGKPGAGWRYTSDYFDLSSNAPEEIVRRAALRLEQIYTAYSRLLPPRHQGGRPTAVLLLTNVADYNRMLLEQKQPFLNPAFYDPAGNRIVCASNLDELGRSLAAVRQFHQRMRADLEKHEVEYAKLYKGKELTKMLQPIAEKRRELNAADVRNNQIFDQATKFLFATLFHEAFHAYLASFVYPPPGELPRWLNEGLAQIFETALLDGADLRVGHADAARLGRAKDALKKNELVPVADMLKSGPKQFLLVHVGDKQVSDRYYLTAWGLAQYLTFERRLLGSAALDRYVEALRDGRDVRKAFEELIGQPLPQFETDFRRYLQLLQLDGSLAPVGK